MPLDRGARRRVELEAEARRGRASSASSIGGGEGREVLDARRERLALGGPTARLLWFTCHRPRGAAPGVDSSRTWALVRFSAVHPVRGRVSPSPSRTALPRVRPSAGRDATGGPSTASTALSTNRGHGVESWISPAASRSAVAEPAGARSEARRRIGEGRRAASRSGSSRRRVGARSRAPAPGRVRGGGAGAQQADRPQANRLVREGGLLAAAIASAGIAPGRTGQDEHEARADARQAARRRGRRPSPGRGRARSAGRGRCR